MWLLVVGAAAAAVHVVLGRVVVTVVVRRLVVGVARVVHVALPRRDRSVTRLNVVHGRDD